MDAFFTHWLSFLEKISDDSDQDPTEKKSGNGKKISGPESHTGSRRSKPIPVSSSKVRKTLKP